MAHPFRDAAIVGAFNTRQARALPGEDSVSITVAAALGALADAGLRPDQVDAVIGPHSASFVYQSRTGPLWCSTTMGIEAVIEAAAMIAAGLANVVLVADGTAGELTHQHTAPWTRPQNEFVASFGMFTAAEFALVARRHMHLFGTTEESMAFVAATIRNHGHENPEAVYFGKGPFTAADVLASRMVAEPFHLLDCATTSEGGCALVVARTDAAADLRHAPVWIVGGERDRIGPAYQHAPLFDLGGRQRPDLVNGWVGRRAAERAFSMAGITVDEVDVCEFYDPFSFEIIRQFEAFGFCGEGEGSVFVAETIGPGGRYPITTDGGTMSFSHSGSAQLLQRVVRGVQQIRGDCVSGQLGDVDIALCTGSGSGALASDVVLLGAHRP